MAERHSKSERQQLKSMLSDAIRVLCQNTVRYNVKLSIEALIGVTVDGGKDVVIMSFNELVGKQAADTTFGTEQYYDTAADSLYTDEQADFMDDENGEYAAAEDADHEYYDGDDSYMPYGTTVKEELTSTVTYGQNHFQQPVSATATTHYKVEPYADNDQRCYDGGNVGMQQGSMSAAKPGMGKNRAAGPGARKRPKLASPAAGKKSGTVGSGGKVSGQQKPVMLGKTQPLNDGEDAVSQITLYTCGTCGAQMQHYGSFMRHKQSHTGQQVFNCDGCGKEIRRQDNLRTHQRRCPAYLSMFPPGGDAGV